MMDNQEAFNIVYSGLRKQGFQRSGVWDRENTDGASFLCRYRAGEHKCAAGFLIPDSLYSSGMEGKNIHQIIEYDKHVEAHLLGASIDLLTQLQNAHDGSNKPGTMQAELRLIATHWNLEVPL